MELTIVSRRNTELLGRIKDNFGFEKATTDWQEVLVEEPDVVVVGSPPGLHHEQAKAALEAGAHVMCEKPFTIDPADAWDLDATAKRTGRQLFVSYGWNYRPMVIEAHRLMHDDGGIGEIEHVSRCTWIRSHASCSARRAIIPGLIRRPSRRRRRGRVRPRPVAATARRS